MSLEFDFFKKKRVVFDKLLPFGFVKDGEDYLYKEVFMDGDFEAQVRISSAGQVSGRVVDLSLGEEYLALRVERQLGTFVGQVRAAYAQILRRIGDSCFEALPFVKGQTNRLAAYIERTYGDAYDHPFAKYPDFSSYRNPANRKWYGLIMVVARGKLDLGQESWEEDELQQAVEIINLKVDPSQMAKLLTQAGIYPSYHMSKKSWVSVVLDEEVPDDLLFSLLDNSRALTAGKSLGNPTGPDFWLIPANPKYYDIDAEFAESKIIDWTQKASIKKGDYVGIYITAPARCLRYLCRVIEADMDNARYPDHPEIKKLMRIELVKIFSDQQFPSPVLKELGVTNIRGPRRMTKDLIEKVEKELGK